MCSYYSTYAFRVNLHSLITERRFTLNACVIITQDTQWRIHKTGESGILVLALKLCVQLKKKEIQKNSHLIKSSTELCLNVLRHLI